MNRHITFVVGARPHYMKLAPLIRKIKDFPSLSFSIVHTGQHYNAELYQNLWNELELPSANAFLNINQKGHTEMVADIMVALKKTLLNLNPCSIVVFGDTNSSVAAAIVAKQLKKTLFHIEAGMRNNDLTMPEEQNRRIIDSISDVLFCSSLNSYEFLNKFDNPGQSIYFSGDLMLDNFRYFYPQSTISKDAKNYIVCTLHREKLFSNKKYLQNCISALNIIDKSIKVIACFHPATFQKISKEKIPVSFENLGPISYLKMMQLINNCRLVITDSGGLQKEAYFAEKKCLTLRDKTEWTETLENSNNMLSAYRSSEVVSKTMEQLESPFIQAPVSHFGEGHAAKIILYHISAN